VNNLTKCCICAALAGAVSFEGVVEAKPIAYPSKGQSQQLQQQDDAACYSWAKNNTGVDPAAVANAPPSAFGSRGGRWRTRSRCGAWRSRRRSRRSDSGRCGQRRGDRRGGRHDGRRLASTPEPAGCRGCRPVTDSRRDGYVQSSLGCVYGRPRVHHQVSQFPTVKPHMSL
jgi:hypothetical protein